MKVSVAGLLASIAGFILLTGCGRSRESLVGTWRGTLYSDTEFVFNSDGTYTSTSFEKRVWDDSDVRFKGEGTWRHEPGWIVFVPKRISATNIRHSKAKFEDLRKRSTGQEARMPIRWNSPNEWQPTEVGMGKFRRIERLRNRR